MQLSCVYFGDPAFLQMGCQCLLHIVFYCSLKSLFVKGNGFAPDIRRIIVGLAEMLHRPHDGLRSLLVEENAELAFLQMLDDIAASVRDERTPRCKGFDGDDAEILLLRKDESLTLPIILRQCFFRYAPQEFDSRPGHFLQTLELRSAADDLERQFQAIECLDGDIVPLVGD